MISSYLVPRCFIIYQPSGNHDKEFTRQNRINIYIKKRAMVTTEYNTEIFDITPKHKLLKTSNIIYLNSHLDLIQSTMTHY